MAKAQDREEAGEGPGQPSSRAHLPRRTLTKRSDEHPSRHVPSCSLNHSESPCVHPLDTAMHVVSKHIKKESAAAHSKV